MAVKDLVSGVLAESITTSTTNVLVTIAQNIGRPGILAFFPTPPFYITIMPKSPAVGVANRLDSEILQVTAVGNDQVGNAALTCVRGQRDTTAKAFEAGSIVTVGVYTDDAVLLGGTGTTETETPWIKTDMVADGAITASKIDFISLIAGAANFTAISAGADQNVKVNIPAQANTNYLVFLTIADHTPYWTELIYRPSEKTTTSFKITAANKGNGSTGAFSINYLVIPQ